MEFKVLFALILLIKTSSAQNTDQTDATFQNECLTVTNQYRAIHDAPPLQLNQSLVNYAISRCNYMSQSGYPSHDGLEDGIGENLYWYESSDPRSTTCTEAISDWYSEEQDYSYNNEDFDGGTLHFTQLVWVATTQMGCARCSQLARYYRTIIVCNYIPMGNIYGRFGQNVLPP